MEKSLTAFRSIGEMANELGLRTHILRYWEEQFPMLRPLKRAGGRRHYRAEDVELLHTINRLLNTEGYTIKGAKNFLANGNGQAMPLPVASSDMVSASTVPADFKRDLRSIRDRLAAALAAA